MGILCLRVQVVPKTLRQETMSNKLYKTFEDVEERAALVCRYWNNFRTEISQYLLDRPEISQDASDAYRREMQELSSNLEQALGNLVGELHNPTLTLATTGTTSSGKSTLVNLLCGAEIVPMAVEEMSAGVVTIEYSEEKSLVIHQTVGATWEWGEWLSINEEEIYNHLEQAMRGYIDNREQQVSLDAPRFTIRYPFKFRKELNLQLPQGTKVEIMDLPGLASVDDKGNADLIKEQCREALCIFTYNSAETDQQKIDKLLNEVVEEVRSLGGYLERMLFVLNRIDVFRDNKDWLESKERFIQKTTNSIKTVLAERLEEQTEAIENLQMVPLSTLPALMSLQIGTGEEPIQDVIKDLPTKREKWSAHDRSRFAKASVSIEACKRAEDRFHGLIRDVLRTLPREAEDWSLEEQNRVAEALWKESYAGNFHQNLKEHIRRHFPQLVIPQMIDRFNRLGGDAVTEWAVQTTASILNSSEENYKQACEKIVQIRSDLQRFLKVSDAKLREPFEKVEAEYKRISVGTSDKDLFVYLDQTIQSLTEVEPYNKLGERLAPLRTWRRELARGIQQVLEVVARSLEESKLSQHTLAREKLAQVDTVRLYRLCSEGW
jgi:predicted GTPase